MIAAVIPARNEARRIGRAVAALRREGVERVLVLANACTDATVARAAEAGALIIETATLAGGVGEARATGGMAALSRWPDASVLLFTDADGEIAPGTATALARALGRAEAVMGRLVPDPADLAHLPRDVARFLDLRQRRDALLAELAALGMPRAHDPAPRHLHRGGALMAFRRDAYLAVGGFRPLPCHEDRDIAERLVRAGFRLAHPWDAAVTVSCRTEGRAPEGMAAFLSARVDLDLHEPVARLESQCRRLAALADGVRRAGPGAAASLAELVRAPDRAPGMATHISGTAANRLSGLSS